MRTRFSRNCRVTKVKESKSALKREVEARQNLAVSLAKLPEKQITNLDLPVNLIKAILEYKKMKLNGPLRRQAQYIGRLIRDVDEDKIKKIKDMLRV